MMRKIAVLVTGSALALSFPVAGAIAESGGVPHDGSHGKGKQRKQNSQNGHMCPTPNGKAWGTSNDDPTPGHGKKCGFVFGGLRSR
jgi:hypothetical protein